MKNKIQKEKAELKIESIGSIINELIDYNAIENYNNIKAFDIKMDYIYDDKDKCYKYTFTIYRGFDKEIICEYHISYRKKINDILNNLIQRLSNNATLLYAAFSEERNSNANYNMVFGNNITVTFAVKDEEDKKFYRKTNEVIRELTGEIRAIMKTSDKNDTKTKDRTQAKKALKIVRAADHIFETMINYNSIDGYVNQKPFKLIIDNTYDPESDINRYSIKILRGSINPTVLFEMRFQIQNNSVLYEDFYEMIMKYLNNSKLLQYQFSAEGTKKKIYGIKLKNNTEINFLSNSSKDLNFFDELKSDNKEAGEKRNLEKKLPKKGE